MAASARTLNPTQRLVAQIDDLHQSALMARNRSLGQNWIDEVRQFYELKRAVEPIYPVFAPAVRVPSLQMLMLQEATDLSDISPRIYVAKNTDWSEFDLDNEYALEAQWQQSRANQALLHMICWALFAGNGFIQVGYDPFARNGMGDIYLDSRPPHSVFVDPNATNQDDWQYIILEDKLYLDEIRRNWPLTGYDVPDTGKVRPQPGEPSNTIELPTGPMQSMGTIGPFGGGVGPSSTARVRTVFIRDYSVKELAPSSEDRSTQVGSPVAIPKYLPAYPRGRIIIEANGEILFNDNNWVPDGRFPLVHMPGMPNLTGFWAPPPVRYTKTIQEMAEKMISQNYENMVRMNRQIVFLRADSGIDPEEFANVPAAAYQYNMTSTKPDFFGPPAFPQQYFEMPNMLLELQKDLQGFPSSRTGKAPAGNVSAPLFEAAISQAQTLTRLRAKLLEDAVERLGSLLLSAMQSFYLSPRSIPGYVKGEMKPVQWTPVPFGEMRQAKLDPASVKPYSQSSRKMMVPLLRQLRMIGIKRGLTMLDFPDAAEAAQEAERELEAGILAKSGFKGGKGGG